MDIHKFTSNGERYLLDVNSGAIHVLDETAYELLDVFTGSNLSDVHEIYDASFGPGVVSETLEELQALVKQGSLFSPLAATATVFATKPVVKSLCLHISHDCNLRCGYCFAGTGAFGHGRSLMSREVGERAVDFLIEHSGSRRHAEIDFFGGEPLLNLDTVKHIVDYIRCREAESGKIFKLTLTTNAVLLDEKTLEYLNKENISLVLSVDGRPAVHDRMRPFIDQAGSHDIIMKNVRRAVESRNGTNYYVRGTYTAYNLDFAADVLWMAEHGLSQLSVEPVVAKDADYELREEHLPELFEQYDLLAAAWLAAKRGGRGFDFFHFNLDIEQGPCLAKRLSGCGAGHEYFAVTPEGDLYPCHQFVGRDDFLLGSVFTGIANRELTKNFRDAHVLNKETCKECWARFFCSGGCHANAHLINDTIMIPYHIGCEIQKKRLECAIAAQVQLVFDRRAGELPTDGE